MIAIDKIPDIDELKTFHSPQRGTYHSYISIPKTVVEVADYLNGRTLSLREAMDEIKMASMERNGKVRLNCDCITLRIDTGFFVQFWCIIKFSSI